MANSSPYSFSSGELIAQRYEIVRVIGSGRMGWTLEALDMDLDGDTVALRILFPQFSGDPELYERISREVVLARQLSSEHIVRTFDLDFDNRHGHFISMEYIDGWSLKRIIDQAYKELSEQYKIEILLSVAKALEFAHKRGVIHRDVRSGNVLISREGQVKLADFSIARSISDESGLTKTGELLGATEYMAPEQFLGQEADCQTDVYSFGLLAFELFSGKSFFSNKDFMKAARSRLETVQKPSCSLPRDVAQWLPELIDACCEKEKEKRIHSGAELVQLISAALPSSAPAAPIYLPCLRKKQRQNKAMALGYLGLAFAVLIALTYLLFSQVSTRWLVGSYILRFERQIGVEFSPLKDILGIRGSLNRPESLFTAIDESESESVQAMLLADMNLDLRNEKGQNPFHFQYLLQHHNISFEYHKVSFLLEQRDDAGHTPLIAAVRSGSVLWLQRLLRFPASINVADYEGRTPLHHAVSLGDIQAIELLIPRSRVDHRDAQGIAAIHLAVLSKKHQILELLLENGANPDLSDSSGRTPLMLALKNHAVISRPQKLYDLLLANNPNLLARDNLGNTALHYAAEFADMTTYATLLAAGADETTRNDAMQSAAQLLRQKTPESFPAGDRE